MTASTMSVTPSRAPLAGRKLVIENMEFRKQRRRLERRVWLSVGASEWPDFTRACRDFFEQLRKSPYEGMRLEVKVVEGERHSGVKPESYNRALRFAFADWAAVEPPV